MKLIRTLEDGTKVYLLTQEELEEDIKRINRLLWKNRLERPNDTIKRSFKPKRKGQS